MELITTHIGADFDSFASMVGAHKLYPGALLSFPGSIEQNVREFLALHKHAIEIKKPRDIPLDQVERLIIVDTRLAQRIGDFAKLLEKDRLSIHIYDHHPPTDQDIRGELNMNESTGATSTILVDIIRREKIALTPLEATILTVGIYEDTGSLTYGSTTPRDLEACAYLLSCGANLNVVSDFINPGLTPEQMKLLNLLINNMKVEVINGVKVVITGAETTEQTGSLSLVVHKLRDMENLNVVFAIIKINNRIQVIGRSRLEGVDAGKILELLGGGGHSRAASARIEDRSMEEVREKLYRALRLNVKPLVLAKEIMSTPVRTVQEDLSVEEARKIMLRFNFSGLPILKGGKLTGIISRSDLDRAIQHGLKRVPVKNYMSSPPITIGPETSLEEIQGLMIRHNIGHLPVIDRKGRLQGMVTRGEVLRILHNEHREGFSLYSSPLVKKSVKPLIEKSAPFMQKILKKIGGVGKHLGYPTFVVGGFVRDLLLGIENLDLDIVVEGDGIRFGKELSRRLNGKVKTYEAFGTSSVILENLPRAWGIELENPLRIDIATARTEFYEYPAALPKVELSSIRQDLYRRDFTINAMAIRLDGRSYGELYDFFGGEEDLAKKRIRVLHNLSFVDDPTRIFRAIRLGARYNLQIDTQTLSFIQNALNLAIFDRLTNERIREELMLILDEADPVKAIIQMDRYGILSCIHRHIKLNSKMVREFYYISDAFSWAILYAPGKIKKWLLYLLGLLRGLKEKEIIEVVDKFKFPVEVRNTILTLFRIPGILRRLSRKGLKPGSIYRILHPLPLEILLFIMATRRRTRVEKYIGLYLTRLSRVKLKIDGEKLKEMGFKPGPEFRKILNSVLEAKLNGRIKDSLDDEMRYVKKIWYGKIRGGDLNG